MRAPEAGEAMPRAAVPDPPIFRAQTRAEGAVAALPARSCSNRRSTKMSAADTVGCAAGVGPPGPERARSAIMERPFPEPQPVCLEHGSSASPPSRKQVFFFQKCILGGNGSNDHSKLKSENEFVKQNQKLGARRQRARSMGGCPLDGRLPIDQRRSCRSCAICDTGFLRQQPTIAHDPLLRSQLALRS